jgi:hypothetical protein
MMGSLIVIVVLAVAAAAWAGQWQYMTIPQGEVAVLLRANRFSGEVDAMHCARSTLALEALKQSRSEENRCDWIQLAAADWHAVP